MDRKNLIIGILSALLIIGSLWGSVGNKSSRALKRELAEARQQLRELKESASQVHSTVLDKTARLQHDLQEKISQLDKARKELVDLRKANKALEATISGQEAEINKLKQRLADLSAASRQGVARQVSQRDRQIEKLNAALAEKDRLLANLDELSAQAAALQDSLQEKEKTITELREQLAGCLNRAEADAQPEQDEQAVAPSLPDQEGQTPPDAASSLQPELEAARAQIIGLEKIIEEKNRTIEEMSQEVDQLRINMDVLLARIRDQQDEMREIREENRQLVKELAGRNRELADLREETQDGDQE